MIWTIWTHTRCRVSTQQTEKVPSLFSWYYGDFVRFQDRLQLQCTVPLPLRMLHGNVSEIQISPLEIDTI